MNVVAAIRMHVVGATSATFHTNTSDIAPMSIKNVQISA